MSLNYWLFFLSTLALTVFIGYSTYSTARLLRTWTPDRNLLLVPAENIVRLVLLAVCIGLGLLSGLDRAQLGWAMPRPLYHSLWGLGWGLGLAAFFYLTTRRLVSRTGERFYSTIVIEAILPQTAREMLLIVLFMVPVVLLEELLFRSLLLGGFSPALPDILLLLGTGALFGVMHSPQGLWGMVGAGGAGVLFGLLFWWYDGLLVPLVAHYVANLVQIGYAVHLQRRGEFPPDPTIH